MRAFIALEIPDRIKKDLGRIQKDLIVAGVQARWAKQEIAHLTLAFLGSITPDKVELIGKIFDEVAAQIKPINLFLSKFGCFPSPNKARIVFVDLSGELGKINALATKIRKRLKKEGIWFDKKPFSAHLTLGRLKIKQNLTATIKKVKIKRVEFTANEVTLTKSILTPSGPTYHTLKKIKIQSASA